ncbi:MAG TPA: PQQ-dependent sugar dehydrogenase [Vicinamibacterales bacterium]|nr:PQQ-dependent sugar dehydrogenase [Vicinamibacterales bacterium]
MPKRALALTVVLLLMASTVEAQLRTRPYVSGLTLPVAFVQDPTDRSVQFVVEQRGRIRVVRNGTVQAPDFLDLQAATLAGGERGLLGLAFPPDAGISGRFFVNFTNRDGHTVVARFRRSSNPVIADPSSRFDLRWNEPSGAALIAQPFSNHNGGHLAFGADGFLYVGLGDGGSGDDPAHRAQDRTTLLGKMLRVDVNVPDAHAIGYVVPSSNPFVSGGARPEVWSFGWRNPWRYNFDDPALGGTGALIAADVGQGRWEEVNYEPAGRGGRNYGWRNREGAHDHVTSLPPAYAPLTDPIHEYGHSVGQSITGGYVYRGTALGASHRGRYFFADFVSSRVWSMGLVVSGNGEARAGDVRELTTELGGASQLSGVSAFGVDADGELYVISYTRGVVLKIVGPPGTPGSLRIIR